MSVKKSKKVIVKKAGKPAKTTKKVVKKVSSKKK